MDCREMKTLIKQIRGVSYKPDDLHDTLNENSIILLRANNIADGQINFDDVVYVDRKKVSTEQILRRGDILICASSGSKNLVGKAASVDFEQEATFGAFCKAVRPNSLDDAAYLSMYFQSPKYRREISEVAIGININNIRNEHIDSLSVNWPDSAKRQQAVGILHKVDLIIRYRRSELRTLDELIKARFVEMFGDPDKNELGWEKVSINTVVHGKASNGYFAKREEYVDNGNVAVLGVAYVVNRMYSQVEGLPRTNATSLDIQKHHVKYGDMLFCRSSLVAEGIGKASIVPENTPENTLFECHVIRLPLDLEKCVPEFMQVLSTTGYFRKQIIAQSKTATMTTIGQDGILKSTIILPPLEKQREFYTFVKQVDKSKAVVQKALDEAHILFNSLMQQYFG